MGLGYRAVANALILALLFTTVVFAADSPQALRPWVIVNSQDHTDVISGAIYAQEIGADYMFVLTPGHGEYLARFFAKSNQPLYYFESDKPVSAKFGQELPTQRLTSRTPASLSAWFAKEAPHKFAVVLSDADGTEAISAAPYATLRGGALFFTDSAHVGEQVSALKAQGYEVLAYGTLAANLTTTDRSIDRISTGSPFSDNLEIVKRFVKIKPSTPLLFASGKTFEKSMVMGGLPLVLIGRTEIPPDLSHWLKETRARNGVVIQGDADIDGAVQSLKNEYGMTLFALLAEGYSGDSQVRPAAVMPLPSALVIPRLETIQYDALSKTFYMQISNIGTSPAYVRTVVSLVDGQTSSSPQVLIGAGEVQELSVPLAVSGLASKNTVDLANVQIYSGSSQTTSEAVDRFAIRNVPVIQIPDLPSPAPVTTANQTQSILIGALMIILVAAAAYLLRPSPVASATGPAKKRRRKRRQKK